jgi:peptidoglycan/LPS O-acetylase OafA/YrhL
LLLSTMTDLLMSDLVHHVYPLLVASAIALAVAPLALPFSLKDDSEDNNSAENSDNIPQSLVGPLKFNIWGRRVAPFLTIVAAILALLYVYPATSGSLFTWSFNILVFTYGLILLAFIVPAFASSKVRLDRFRERQRIQREYDNKQKLDYNEKE